MLGEGDAALPVPAGGVVKGGGHPGIEPVSERRQEGQHRQYAHDQHHRRAIAPGVLQVGIPPECAGRAQGERRPQQGKQRGEPHRREVQRPRHIGIDRLQRIRKRVLAVFPRISVAGQRQRGRLAGEIQAAGQAALGFHRHLPEPALAGSRTGFIGGRHRQGEQRILHLGMGGRRTGRQGPPAAGCTVPGPVPQRSGYCAPHPVSAEPPGRHPR